MFQIDNRQIEQLANRLEDLNERGLAFARRNTLNDLAFETMREGKQEIRDEFINRNRWTQGSVRIDRARSTRDSAAVGSVEQYMADQEFGATKTKGTNVPTPTASGEAPRARVRRKVVQKRARMANIRLATRARHRDKNQKQANIVSVQEAIIEGRKYVYQERGRVKGIYRITGGKRHPKTRMVQNLSFKVIRIPRQPWLGPATERAQAKTPQLWGAQLQRQLDRVTR